LGHYQHALLHKYQSATEIVDRFLQKGNIAPLLEYMQSQEMYTSLKPETFNQQNELTPQAMFVSHLNIQQKRTLFEQTINDNNRWVDALSIYDNIINVTEWKNLQLDFLEIEGLEFFFDYF